MTCFFPQELYGIIGWPLSQSLSPLIHNTGFQTLQIPGVYLAWPLPPERLADFVTNLEIYRVRGLSITIPHKQAVMPLLKNISDGARLAGAVNTLYWREDVICGDNTDVTGFLAPLANYPGMRLPQTRVLLLGAGGAAHAAAAGLTLSGCRSVIVTSPGNKRQYELANRFDFTPVSWDDRYKYEADLIINTTPLGMYGREEGKTAYDFALAPGHVKGVAYDMVYNPLQTRFLREAETCGWRTVPGLAMFFAQGNAQFHLWTGRNLPEEARLALSSALNKTV